MQVFNLVQSYLSSRSPRVPGHAEIGASEEAEYDLRVQNLRVKEYPQLHDVTYLDNAASPPYPTSLITSIQQSLLQNLYSNPHSHSPSSLSTANQISDARALILRKLFHVGVEDGWDVVFQSGTTAALRLVGEGFDWADGAEYVHLLEGHTSLIGIRDLAHERGGTSRAVTEEELRDYVRGRGDQRTLVGLPLQCNATGQRNDTLLESLTQCIQQIPAPENIHILIDLAAYLSPCQPFPLPASTSPGYLTAPSFLAFSMYKLFGYPTGLGCLIVKRSALPMLLRNKTYFGGGTVDAITAGRSWKVKRKGVEGLEDGTGNVHAIVAVPHAFRVFEDLYGSREDQRRHLRSLARSLYLRAAATRHGNGAPLLKVYSRSAASAAWAKGDDSDNDDQDPTLNFNVLSASGRLVPPSEVDRLACVQNIHLRSGRHCNAGFITSQVGASDETIKKLWRDGLGCDDAGSAGGVEGVSASLRVSLGVWSTTRDIDRFFEFLERFFVQAAPPPSLDARLGPGSKRLGMGYELKEIIVYPIKSCAGQTILRHQTWPLEKTGLRHDREWVIVELGSGKALSQKKYAKMTLIRPTLDLEKGVMEVKVGDDQFKVDIGCPNGNSSSTSGGNHLGLCGDVPSEAIRPALSEDKEIRRILSEWLGVPCTLARQNLPGRHSKLGQGGSDDRVPLLLSNESPFLLLNEDSVDKVTDWMRVEGVEGNEAAGLVEAKAASFRGNLVIGRVSSSPTCTSLHLEAPPLSYTHGQNHFVEDNISQIVIGSHTFAALGRCRRCQMVCIDQTTGEHAPETYLCLSRRRRNDRGRIEFGMHLMWREDLEVGGLPSLGVGMPITMRFDNEATVSDD